MDVDGNGLIQSSDLIINLTGNTGFASANMAMNVTGGTGVDTIVTGDGADTITPGTGGDTITGGKGVDTFAFGTNGSLVAAKDTITDFNTGGSDVLTFGGNTTVLAAEANGTTATSDVDTSAGGKITFAAADDTYAEQLVAVQADTQLDAVGSIAFWELSGDTYVYYAGAATGNADDQIIILQGVTGLTTITGGATTTIG